MNIQPLEHTQNDTDLVPLFLPHGLFLKPFARLNVSVALPQMVTGKTVSNWDLMEKLRSMIKPARFAVLKVSKSTLEFIRFEGELEGDDKCLNTVLQQLDGRNIRLASFKDLLKVRATAAKDTFPSRTEWDAFFRDARDSDDKQPGQRPDTVRLANLPIRWFRPRHQENDESARPSESIFKRIFEKFGNVRTVDIPVCDPYRKHMKSHIAGVKTLAYDQDVFFEGYVQFEEYAGFAATMRALRNQKLIRKEDKYFAVNIVVDFDRDRHLSDASIKRRQVVRDRCIAKELAKEEEERKKKLAEEERLEQERQKLAEQKQLELDKQLERENKRKEKQLQKLRSKELIDMSSKIRAEAKAVALAQRRMESVRVLRALFERIEIKAPQIANVKLENGGPSSSAAAAKARKAVHDPEVRNHRAAVRDKCVKRFVDEFTSRKQALETARSTGIFRAVLKASGSKRSPSGSSISSDDSVLSDSKQRKKKKKNKQKQKLQRSTSSAASVSSGMSEEVETKPLALLPHPPGAFPVFNPVTGQWMNMGMGMYGNPFLGAAAARGDYYANAMAHSYHSHRGITPYRGGPRGGGAVGGGAYQRGGGGRVDGGAVGMRGGGGRGGRGGYQSYDTDTYYNNSGRHNNHHDNDNHHHHNNQQPHHYRRATDRPRYSHSPSGRTGGRGRSRDGAGGRGGGGGGGRSRSRSRPTRRSRHRSRSRGGGGGDSKAAKPKLASTLRQSNSSDRWSSRSRSVSRSKARRSWSRRKSASSSASESRSRSRGGGRHRHNSRRRSNRSRSRSRSRSSSSSSRSRSRSRHSRRSRSRSHRRSPAPSASRKRGDESADRAGATTVQQQQQQSGSAEQSSRSNRSSRKTTRDRSALRDTPKTSSDAMPSATRGGADEPQQQRGSGGGRRSNTPPSVSSPKRRRRRSRSTRSSRSRSPKRTDPPSSSSKTSDAVDARKPRAPPSPSLDRGGRERSVDSSEFRSPPKRRTPSPI